MLGILFNSQLTSVSIHEATPAEFVTLCSEVHDVVKPELISYFHNLITKKTGAIYVAHNPMGEPVGRVAVEIHPGYTSRGKPCAIFGWLDGISGEVVKQLLDQATEWVVGNAQHRTDSRHSVTLVRGPISLPKGIGGIGCQIKGFNLPRMHSVSTNRPGLAALIESAGFVQDAHYACVDVSDSPRWESARLPIGYSVVYWTQKEWIAHNTDVLDALQQAFAGILPDSSGPGRFWEIIDTMSYHPDSRYMNPVVLAPDGKIAGLVACTPNLYEAWDGKPITGVNVDTIFITPPHRGHGLFSTLNNVERFNTFKYLNLTHFEGTSIWLANENAVKSIFPHGHICRRHVVYQKRLKKDTLRAR